MKGADKWQNKMHNYEDIQIYGPISKAYRIPGAELGRAATKPSTV